MAGEVHSEQAPQELVQIDYWKLFECVGRAYELNDPPVHAMLIGMIAYLALDQYTPTVLERKVKGHQEIFFHPKEFDFPSATAKRKWLKHFRDVSYFLCQQPDPICRRWVRRRPKQEEVFSTRADFFLVIAGKLLENLVEAMKMAEEKEALASGAKTSK